MEDKRRTPHPRPARRQNGTQAERDKTGDKLEKSPGRWTQHPRPAGRQDGRQAERDKTGDKPNKAETESQTRWKRQHGKQDGRQAWRKDRRHAGRQSKKADTAAQTSWKTRWETRLETRERQAQRGGHSIPDKAETIRMHGCLSEDRLSFQNVKCFVKSCQIQRTFQSILHLPIPCLDSTAERKLSQLLLSIYKAASFPKAEVPFHDSSKR